MVCQYAQLNQSVLLDQPAPEWLRNRIAVATARLERIAQRIEFVSAPIGFEDLQRAADGAAVVFVDYLQLIRHPDPGVRGHERIEDAMAKIAEAAQRTEAAFILAAAQGRSDAGEKRAVNNAARGSSSIEFTVDALYCAEDPGEQARRDGAGFTVEFKCFKQREGALIEFEVPIDGRTGLIVEERAQ
jgi:replicative DNA helicase